MVRQVQLRPGALDEGASSYRVTGAGEDADPASAPARSLCRTCQAPWGYDKTFFSYCPPLHLQHCLAFRLGVRAVMGSDKHLVCGATPAHRSYLATRRAQAQVTLSSFAMFCAGRGAVPGAARRVRQRHCGPGARRCARRGHRRARRGALPGVRGAACCFLLAPPCVLLKRSQHTKDAGADVLS